MKELYEQARKEIPYTDEEIRDLFIETKSTPRFKGKSVSRLLVELVLLPGSIGLAFFSIAISIEVSSPGFAFFFPALVAFFISLSSNSDILRSGLSKRDIDVYDPEVLSVVASHISTEPLLHADQLRYSIELSRAKIEKSLNLLPTIISHLKQEVDQTIDVSVKLLVESKMSAAESALSRLAKADADLVQQAEETDLAVAPVREMVAKMERISSLSASLASIQAAHGLATEAEAEVSQNALELKLLRAVSHSAMAQLNDIQKRFEADSSARIEMEDTLRQPDTEETQIKQ